MANITIINARAVTGGRITTCNLRLAEGKIRGILPPGDTYGKTYDAKGALVLPGFIDLHTHGGGGLDFQTAGAKEMSTIRDMFASRGVTSFLPTVLADTEENMLRAVLSIAKAKRTLGCPQIAGIHLEGPFLSREYCDEVMPEMLQTPSYALYRRLQDASEGIIRVMTIAPELPGAVQLIDKVSSESVRVSLGHTGASYDTAVSAIDAGAISATHVFNDMQWMTPAAPSVSTAVLESDMFCEIMCDSRYLHPATIRLLLKTKGLSRLLGITNSICAAGLDEGIYRLGTRDMMIRNGQAQLLENGKHAGSTLTMMESMLRFMEYTGLPLEQAILPFTETPARFLGLSNQKGSINVGRDADLVVVDDNFKVRTTFFAGEVLYNAT